jgi:hypothetical protein
MVGMVDTPSAPLKENAPAFEKDGVVLGPAVPSKDPEAVARLVWVARVVISAV